MSKSKKGEIWDIFRHNQTPPLPPQSAKSSFLPSINKALKEPSSMEEEVPKLFPKYEEMPNLEVRGRLRELELQLMDLRAGIERRLSSVSEDFPNRLNKELRIIQERDSYLWKENTSKQLQISESLKQTQDYLRSCLESINTNVVDLKRKMEEINLKQSATVRDLEMVAKMPRIMPEPKNNQDLAYVAMINKLKDEINTEKMRREEMQNEHNKSVQELHSLFRNFSMEHSKRLQEYRDQILLTQNESKGQLIGIEISKDESIKNEQEYMKMVYSNLQKRVEEEVLQRVQLEKEYKNWTDSRLNSIQKIMKNEEKGLADREANLLGMMQEGLGALHEIISRVKETSSAQVTKVHTVMSENIKDLAQALGSIKDSLFARIEAIEFSLQEEGKYRIEQFNNAMENISNIVESNEKEKIYFENVIMSAENRSKSEIYEIKQDLVAKELENNEWKNKIEQFINENQEKMMEKIEKYSKECEVKNKDLKEFTVIVSEKINSLKNEINFNIEQVKNNANFGDNLIEQKIENSLNHINDKFTREILENKQFYEKVLANNNSENASNLLMKMEQFQKLFTENIKSSIFEESKLRKNDMQVLEFSIKQVSESISAKMNLDFSNQISDLNEKIEKKLVEKEILKNELQKIRLELASSVEQLFLNIDDIKEKIKIWADSQIETMIDHSKEEFKVLIEVERELLLKEIDTSKNESKNLASDLSKNLQNLEENLKKNFEVIDNERKTREKEAKDSEKRIENIMGLMQEAINQSSEAVKAVCRALVTKEAAERNNSQENILKSIQARMAALEDLLKFYTLQASEELRLEIKELLETEKNQRVMAETEINKKNKKLKETVKENKEKLEIEMCLKEIVDNVVNEDLQDKMKNNEMTILNSIKKETINRISEEKKIEKNIEDVKKEIEKSENLNEVNNCLKSIIDEIIAKDIQNKILSQKNDLEIVMKTWVDNFEKELEETGMNLEKNIEEVNEKIEKLDENIEKIIDSKVEVRSVIDGMISLIEKMDTNEFITSGQNNIEVLFRNMQKLEEFILSTKEDIEKNEKDYINNEISKELEKISQRDTENLDILKERIQFIIEKLDDLEKSDHQKAINILMDQMANVKQDLYLKQEILNEITAKQEELIGQHEELIKSRSKDEKELQENIKILAESNMKIEESINKVQHENQTILQQLHDHDSKLNILINHSD